jgi:copper oxidase (laccase) domain-containing protein
MIAWFGPAIGPAVYEVGAEVRDAFIAHDALASRAFARSPPRQSPRKSTPAQPTQHWLADLYELARQRLRAAGVTEIYGGGLCTFSDSARFFSYRRDGITGRMACGIWLSEH